MEACEACGLAEAVGGVLEARGSNGPREPHEQDVPKGSTPDWSMQHTCLFRIIGLQRIHSMCRYTQQTEYSIHVVQYNIQSNAWYCPRDKRRMDNISPSSYLYSFLSSSLSLTLSHLILPQSVGRGKEENCSLPLMTSDNNISERLAVCASRCRGGGLERIHEQRDVGPQYS